MTNGNDRTGTIIDIADARFQHAIADLGPTVIALGPKGLVTVYEVGHLNGDTAAWHRFFNDVIGGDGTVAYKSARTEFSLFCWFGPEGDNVDYTQFNAVATMLLADQHGARLDEATPVLGTAVVTGFDYDMWMPKPLDQGQLTNAVNAIAANKRNAPTVAATLNDRNEAR